MKRFSKPKKKYSSKKNAMAIKKLKHAPEIKYIQQIRPYLASVLGLDTHLLNGMQKGTDWGDRVGQFVTARFLEINVYIYNQHLTQSNRVRLTVVNDKYPQSIPLQPGRLFADNTNNLSIINSLEDKEFQNDFKFLYDKVFTLSSHDTSSDSQDERHVRIRIPIRNKISYNAGNMGDATDIELNAIYLVYTADNITTNWYYSSAFSYIDT